MGRESGTRDTDGGSHSFQTIRRSYNTGYDFHERSQGGTRVLRNKLRLLWEESREDKGPTTQRGDFHERSRDRTRVLQSKLRLPREESRWDKGPTTRRHMENTDSLVGDPTRESTILQWERSLRTRKAIREQGPTSNSKLYSGAKTNVWSGQSNVLQGY